MHTSRIAISRLQRNEARLHIESSRARSSRLRLILQATVATFLLGVLLAPISANAVPGNVSATTEAEVVATAFDGGGTSELRKRRHDEGFSEFFESVDVRDRNADSGRSGRGEALQHTEILTTTGTDVIGVNSRGTVKARFNDPNPADSLVPFGSGESNLTVDLEVTGEPVLFSLTGEVNASGGSTVFCAEAAVGSPSGTFHEASSGCGGSGSTSIDEIGELPVGSHRLSVILDARASGGGAFSSGALEASYDIALRFCTITIAQSGLTTQGTAGDDVICGTSGDDTILGLGGEDRIYGLGGADTLEGGNAGDTLEGGPGNDLRVYGGPGNDRIEGGPGNDGADGDLTQVLVGGPGNDDIDGGPGNDMLVGRCLEAALGNPSSICPDDPLVAGELDDDNLVGGPGDDRMHGDGGSNFILGNDGEDVATVDGPEANTIVLGKHVDRATGGTGPDEIDGGGGSDRLLGEEGADCLIGGPRPDVLRGGDDNDKLLAKDGARDTVAGGAGPDRGRFDPQDVVSSVSFRNHRGGC